MFPVLEARWLAPQVKLMKIEAARIARAHSPGHFVIVRVRKDGERIPLTIADSDAALGTISLIIQAVGATTELLTSIAQGAALLDVSGPLGKPTELERFGHVVLVGGGVGTAVIYPQAKAFHNLGSRVSAIIGGRTKEYVILEEDLGRFCSNVYPCTDDGSYGFHGLVTMRLDQVLQSELVDAVITAGPVPMMKAIAEVTRPHGVKTIASLNPIMVDGTGMCGGCRVTVGGKQKFACVDGPEFDAHLVDFAELTARLSSYKDFEKHAADKLHRCRLEEAAK
jgi:ferredoxin/flavodoxin---NADP+ reductase